MNLCTPICFLQLYLNSLEHGESKSLNNGEKVIKDATTSVLAIFKTLMMLKETTSTTKKCSNLKVTVNWKKMPISTIMNNR